MRAVSAFGTRSLTRPSSRSSTSPYPERSAERSSSSTVSVLYAANWSPSRASGPSKRILPWWMTIDALAERLDVRHVVARQQHGRVVAAVVLGDERADPLLHRHVEPDRRLVEEEHLRPVQQRADHLDLHPLAEREVPHRLADEVADVEQLDQLVAQRRELGTRDPVDRPVQLERVERGQVPLELVAVAHHERDPAEEVALALRGDVAEHARLAGGRVEQPGEHLQRRRLAGAVRAEEADDLSLADLEEMSSTARTSRCLRRTRLLTERGGPPPARGRRTSCSARRR